MSAIGDILEVTRANLAAASNGDPTPCFDGAIEAMEALEKALVLVLLREAEPDRVETELSALLASWKGSAL